MLIDTHCHLDFKDFDPDRDDVINRALKAGVMKIINVASSIEGSHRSVELANKYDMVYATVGVHPHDAKSVTDSAISELKALAKDKKVVAIGEVGLDYYRNLSPKEDQASAFKKFVYLALDLDLPLIIHAREADRDALDMLKSEKRDALRGVIHCFSGNADFMKECLDIGFFISFTANITFKKADDLRMVARDIPPERLLLETDAPFLAPQAMRGKRNEPAYLTHLVGEWSRLLDLSKDDVARITTHNANSLFKLKLDESSKIAYEIRDSLYFNITNRCTNSCDFCVRNQTSFVKGHNLRLDEEPSAEEIIKTINPAKKYKEIVFCGYGEPTMRLDVIKEVAGALKARGGVKIRVVTNGHGDLINSRNIAKELAGLVDKVSVSLNTDTAEAYNKYCKPEFGPDAYGAVINFIKDCVKNKIEVEVTCLDLPGVDLKRCETIAKELGGIFRPRSLGVVG
ncbi:MAG: YchF/TatD family DNA exonuclease [Candidatus Omnitrophica bacterium]|nr:YchF/TatD family DNA exonuclease [Candidatus Omnitrophota bacterium]